MLHTIRTNPMKTTREQKRKEVFDLIEALEAEPHLGMTESRNIWNAYAKLVRAVGGKPMRKWWKKKSPNPKGQP